MVCATRIFFKELAVKYGSLFVQNAMQDAWLQQRENFRQKILVGITKSRDGFCVPRPLSVEKGRVICKIFQYDKKKTMVCKPYKFRSIL